MMSAISHETPALRANPEGRLLKPVVKQPTKTKLIRLTDAQLKLIERAAKSLDPRPSSSYFIVQAALERATAIAGRS
jgi:hypothetical protein